MLYLITNKLTILIAFFSDTQSDGGGIKNIQDFRALFIGLFKIAAHKTV